MGESRFATQLTRVGRIEVLGLWDGLVHLPLDYFRGVDWARHRDLVMPDGRVELPIGCYLVTIGQRRVLVDVGLGRRRLSWAVGGRLIAALRRSGVAPEEIDTVVCTHLHADHTGWLVTRAGPTFPNAVVRISVTEWAYGQSKPSADSSRQAVAQLASRGQLELVARSGDSVAPGISIIATPGHTPGHVSVRVESEGASAVLLGDVVTIPRQVQEASWVNTTDWDHDVSRVTRSRLWGELAGSRTIVGAAHFPDLAFGQITRASTGYSLTPATGSGD